jgi:PAS domain S-box-containing protein
MPVISSFPPISNDAFREIFQSMSEGILMVDEDGLIVTANHVSEELFGYEKDGLTGVFLEELLPERFRGHHLIYRQEFNAHPEPRRMGIGRDLCALRKDKREFPIEISLSYTTSAGKLLVMAFISDISERKKAEEALKRSEEQLIVYAAELEKKVETRTEALNKTIEELEREIGERKKAEEESQKALVRERELNDLKSKFVSIASHEFRTPLSTILSSVALVEQYKERGDLGKIDKHTQRVKTSVNHLTGILNDFLSLGKLEEGRISPVFQRVNLTDLINDIIEEIKVGLKEGQSIEVEFHPAQLEVTSDSRMLRNVLFNLLSNASKYSEKKKTIHMSCTVQDRDFIIDIRDEGIGIPEEDRKHLFERFFRAGNVSNIQGTGLGLHIVRRYLDLLEGSIRFESTYGTGSTFTLQIPDKSFTV